MKRVSKIVKWLVSTLLLAYLLLIAMLHIPYIQNLVGQWTAHELSRLLDTEVQIGRVNMGLLNRVIIDNVSLKDQRRGELADLRRVAVTFDVSSLMRGDFVINTAQVMGLKARLYRASANQPLNAQFIVDRLSSDTPDTEKSPLRLRIHTLILRHCSVDYDVLDVKSLPHTFSPSHIHLRNIALTAELHVDEADSLAEVQLRCLDFSEKSSGFKLHDLQAHIVRKGDIISVNGIDLQLRDSRFQLANARWDGQRLKLRQAVLRLSPDDLAGVVPAMAKLPAPISFTSPLIEADSTSVHATSLSLATANDSVRLAVRGLYLEYGHGDIQTLNLPDLRFTSKSDALPQLLAPLSLPAEATEAIARSGALTLSATALYNGQEGEASGELRTEAGLLTFDLRRLSDNTLTTNVKTLMDMGRLLGERSGGMGMVAGKVNLVRQADTDIYACNAEVDSIQYKGRTIRNIEIGANYEAAHQLTADLRVADRQADLSAKAAWEPALHHLQASVSASHFNPHGLGLTEGLEEKTFAFRLNTNLTGTSLSDMLGQVTVDSLVVSSPDEITTVEHLAVASAPISDGRHLTAEGDFINGYLDLSNNYYIHSSYFDIRLRDIPIQLSMHGAVDSLLTDVKWQVDGKIDVRGELSACLGLNPQSLSPKTVSILPSDVVIDDTLWRLSPARVSIDGSRVSIDHFGLSNGTRFLRLDGTLSDHPSDSLVCTLEDMDLSYVLSLVDFHAVEFGGQAFGQAVVRRPQGELQFGAQLRVDNFTLNDGRLGTAYILAGQDAETGGIRVSANIPDKDDFGLSRLTVCNGYIAPAKNDIHLTIMAKNTNVEFLNGFLKSTFKDIEGSTNGVMEIVGPLSEVDLRGDMVTDASLTLRPTGVRYHVSPTDTLRFRPRRFLFDNVTITDTLGRSGTVNGQVSHRNLKNFGYDLRFNVKEMLVYEETEWNSDKFKGTIFSTGTIRLQGSDGHPLHITADITPTRGSYFAYDAATPDAITASTFISFTDRAATAVRDSLSTDSTQPTDQGHPTEEEYTGDIFMDANIHMNPQCELRLRMDQSNDAYICAFGSGNLQAHYYNKGPFTLDGTYNIDDGRYRLFLQDIIYRDLLLQRGSNVVFNGNPFDADIHLICHHTLQAVPITDLLGNSSSLGSTSRVRVVCVLDITGHLGNMDFSFDLQLPNVNDEVRSIVRSLISTDEEMDRQIIYLLGLGRFYTAEYALASGGDNVSTNAMSSLLSSTLSGQINQMLEGVLGQNSSWNFGTGLSTGEQGWEDLDVEGILSGRLLDDRLLINGNFGYRNNTLTQNASFIGDFDVKWLLREGGNTYLKAYNRANDRYFTKATLNTQGIGISYQKDFESWKQIFRRNRSTTLQRTDSASSGVNRPAEARPGAR